MPEEVDFTGVEPFMNLDIIDIINFSLDLGFRVLLLKNAMQPMQQKKPQSTGISRSFRSLQK